MWPTVNCRIVQMAPGIGQRIVMESPKKRGE